MAKHKSETDTPQERYWERKGRRKPEGRRSVAQLSDSNGDTFSDKSLAILHEAGHFDELLWELRSGKEATVYVVEGVHGLLAAKLYTDARVRTFQNDHIYKEGRYVSEARIKQALQERRRTGVTSQQALWIAEEFWQMQALWEAGVRVPKPIDLAGRVVLMEYIGDHDSPAPRLADLRLSDADLVRTFQQAVDNMVLMLQAGRVHGDYSAYNLLWWKEQVIVIDFPQMVEWSHNRHAQDLLKRDVESLCLSFQRLGYSQDPVAIFYEVMQRAER